MEEEKINIIMSAYKAETTISRAIESVLSQTYNNWELIIVNDCSPDSTKEIAESYASKDERIRLINNPENLGAGMARRIGLEHRSEDCEYTMFLDSDDYYSPDMVETLYKAAKKEDADIVECGINVISHTVVPNVYGYYVFQEDEKFINNDPLIMSCINKLIAAKLWNKVEYSSRRFIEDTPTMPKLIYYANKLVCLDYVGYNYTINSTSLMHTASELKKVIYLILATISIYKFASEVSYDILKKDSIKIFLMRVLKLKMLKANNSKSYYNEIRQYKDELVEIFDFMLNIIDVEDV